MRNYFSLLFIIFTLIFFPLVLRAGDTMQANERINHSLEVMLFPVEHRISVKDTITVSDNAPREFHFFLHRGLVPVSSTPGVIISRDTDRQGKDLPESFRVLLPDRLQSFRLEYEGSINHPLETYGNEQARGIRQTPGIISDEGVFLSGDSYWYPVTDAALVTFDLHVVLPSEWDVVSQGKRTEHL